MWHGMRWSDHNFGEQHLKDSLWGTRKRNKVKTRNRETVVKLLFTKWSTSALINRSCFSIPTTENLCHLWVFLNFLNFISDCSRVKFLKLLLIHGWTPTYLTIGSKDIYDANSISLTTIFIVDEHFQDLREILRPAFQMVLKKNSSVSQNLLSWTNCHWSHVYKHHLFAFPVICLLPLYCCHIRRLKDQKCQLLANRCIFTHQQISMRTNTKLLQERGKYITCILGLLSDFC